MINWDWKWFICFAPFYWHNYEFPFYGKLDGKKCESKLILRWNYLTKTEKFGMKPETLKGGKLLR